MRGDRWSELQRLIRLQTDECVLWSMLDENTGYGYRINQPGTPRSTRLAPHVIACTLRNGPRPGKLLAAHSCNVRACINPLHLDWKTGPENAADRYVAGTVNHGERNGWAKLTEDIVREIRASTERAVVLANRYGVERHAIHSIKRRNTWRHVQ